MRVMSRATIAGTATASISASLGPRARETNWQPQLGEGSIGYI